MVDFDQFTVRDQRLSRSTEWTLSVDVQLQLYGVTLQGEYAGSRILYDTRPTRRMPMVGVEIPGQFEPDYVAKVAYLLLAWELPLADLIGDVRITPYGMLEWSDPKDYNDSFKLWVGRFGLNVKPN